MSSSDQYYTKSFMREEQEAHANDAIVPPQNEYFQEYTYTPYSPSTQYSQGEEIITYEEVSIEIELMILIASLVIIVLLCRGRGAALP